MRIAWMVETDADSMVVGDCDSAYTLAVAKLSYPETDQAKTGRTSRLRKGRSQTN